MVINHSPYGVEIYCKHHKEGQMVVSANLEFSYETVKDFTEEHENCPILEKFGKNASEIRLWFAVNNYKSSDYMSGGGY